MLKGATYINKIKHIDIDLRLINYILKQETHIWVAKRVFH